MKAIDELQITVISIDQKYLTDALKHFIKGKESYHEKSIGEHIYSAYSIVDWNNSFVPIEVGRELNSIRNLCSNKGASYFRVVYL